MECLPSEMRMTQVNVLLLLVMFGSCCCEGLVVTSPRQQRHPSRRCSAEGGQGPHKTSSNLLEQIRKHAVVWADTANVHTVKHLEQSLGLEDVTTNPSIVSATARQDAGAEGSDIRLQVWPSCVEDYVYSVQI